MFFNLTKFLAILIYHIKFEEKNSILKNRTKVGQFKSVLH